MTQESPSGLASVKIQLLLPAGSRTDTDLARVVERLRAMDIEVTSQGRASVSARVSPTAFESLFGMAADTSHALTVPELPIPGELAGMVQSITLAPAHTTFGTDGKHKS